MPYPKNFAVRLIVCILGMLAIWFGVRFILSVVVFHEELVIQPIRLAIPVTHVPVTHATNSYLNGSLTSSESLFMV